MFFAPGIRAGAGDRPLRCGAAGFCVGTECLCRGPDRSNSVDASQLTEYRWGAGLLQLHFRAQLYESWPTPGVFGLCTAISRSPIAGAIRGGISPCIQRRFGIDTVAITTRAATWACRSRSGFPGGPGGTRVGIADDASGTEEFAVNVPTTRFLCPAQRRIPIAKSNDPPQSRSDPTTKSVTEPRQGGGCEHIKYVT